MLVGEKSEAYFSSSSDGWSSGLRNGLKVLFIIQAGDYLILLSKSLA
tara:strand:- start:993 stop:1133 length:141 start_codon:yes stop_codon:yes gene_type:complete